MISRKNQSENVLTEKSPPRIRISIRSRVPHHPGSYHTPKIHTIPGGGFFLREINGTREKYENTIPGGSLRDYIRIILLSQVLSYFIDH